MTILNPFRFIMLSAAHENGGNCLQRFLDSHPQLMVYPFESQISTPLSANILAGPNHWVAQRYAYPEFGTETTPEQAYHSIWDEELKTYLRARERSKFRDCGLVMDENERVARFTDWFEAKQIGNICIGPPARCRRNYVESFFRSTFDTWSNFTRTGRECAYVGYSPPILFDTDKILSDFPSAHIIHVVRNPWSGYADTKKRPFPMSLQRYCQIWSMTTLAALQYQVKYPQSFRVIRYEDLVHSPKETLDRALVWAGLEPFAGVPVPSFNRQPLKQVYPWGTIKRATEVENILTSQELRLDERSLVGKECSLMAEQMGYENQVNAARRLDDLLTR